jgi:hypothetical protein
MAVQYIQNIYTSISISKCPQNKCGMHPEFAHQRFHPFGKQTVVYNIWCQSQLEKCIGALGCYTPP